jgi:hypothetical protein
MESLQRRLEASRRPSAASGCRRLGLSRDGYPNQRRSAVPPRLKMVQKMIISRRMPTPYIMFLEVRSTMFILLYPAYVA